MDYMTLREAGENGGSLPGRSIAIVLMAVFPELKNGTGLVNPERCKKPIDGRTKLGKERKGNGE